MVEHFPTNHIPLLNTKNLKREMDVFEDVNYQEEEEEEEAFLILAAMPVQEGRTIWNRKNLFVEFSDLEFRRHFRMFKPTFCSLLDIIKEDLDNQTETNQTNRGLPLPPADQLGIGLSYLATGRLG